MAVDELIIAVNVARNGCWLKLALQDGRGDNAMVGLNEDRDDGNNFGGDGCVANCVRSRERMQYR